MDKLKVRNKTFEVLGYTQTIKYLIDEETRIEAIQDILCTCRYGTVHADAWVTSKRLCKHIKKLVTELERLEKR